MSAGHISSHFLVFVFSVVIWVFLKTSEVKSVIFNTFNYISIIIQESDVIRYERGVQRVFYFLMIRSQCFNVLLLKVCDF